MNVIKATVQAGRLDVQVPPEWPDGTEVEIQPLTDYSRPPGDDEPMTPEEIARTLAAMDKVEPFEMTAEEEAALEADRQARKQWEKAHFAEHAEKLRRQWE
jgi:hypothetical protein